MSSAATLEALDLSALLCSRVRHDLISPSGAIINGLEVFRRRAGLRMGTTWILFTPRSPVERPWSRPRRLVFRP